MNNNNLIRIIESICCNDSFEACEVIRWVGGLLCVLGAVLVIQSDSRKEGVCAGVRSRSLAHPRRSSLSLSERPRDLGVSLSLSLPLLKGRIYG